MLKQPIERDALAHAVSNPATLAAVATATAKETCERFVQSVADFARANEVALRNRVLSFVMNATTTATNPLNVARMNECVTRNQLRITVTPDLNFVRSDEASMRIHDAQNRTRTEKTFEIVLSSTYAYYVVAGQLVLDEDVVDQSRQLPVRSPFRRPIAEFDAILKDHDAEILRAERGLTYWKNKQGRILVASPDKTEKTFHRALFRWLRDNVADRLRIYGETRGLGQDATDITIVTPSGSYVVEVKWLGENENGQKYGEVRITQGLKQVSLYLERDTELVCGYLVCFDGRSFEKYTNESGYDANVMHVACEHPRILFLESETPSQVADAIRAS